MDDTLIRDHVDVDSAPLMDGRGDKSILGRSLAGSGLFSATNQPAVSPSTIRADPRIIAHYRDHTYGVLRKLHDMIEAGDTPPGIRLAAISEYLTRAMGKPVQAVDINLDDRRPVVVDAVLTKLVEGLAPSQDGTKGA